MDIISSTNSSHTYKTSISSTGNLQHVFDTGAGGIQEFKVNGTTQLSISPSAVTVPTLVVSTGLTVAGSDISSNSFLSLSGITAGQAASGKALILDLNGSIAGITSLASTTLNGKLGVGSGDQSNITTVGTLGSLTVTNAVTAGSLVVGSASLTATELGFIDGITAGTAANNKALVLNATGGVTGIASLTATGAITAGSLSTAGALVSGSISTAGVATLTNATASTSTTTGALVVSGGVGIAGRVSAGSLTCGSIASTQPIKVTTASGTPASLSLISTIDLNSYPHLELVRGALGDGATDWRIENSGLFTISSRSTGSSFTTQLSIIDSGKVGINILNPTTALDVNGTFRASGVATLSDATVSSSVSTGALVVTGGVGVGGQLSAGSLSTPGSISAAGSVTCGTINATGSSHILTSSGSTFLTLQSSSTGVARIQFIRGSGAYGTNSNTDWLIQNDSEGTLIFASDSNTITGDSQLKLSPTKVSVSPTTASTSTTTGALTVAGGVGIAGQVTAGSITANGNINTSGNIIIEGTTSPILSIRAISSGVPAIELCRNAAAGTSFGGSDSFTDWRIGNNTSELVFTAARDNFSRDHFRMFAIPDPEFKITNSDLLSTSLYIGSTGRHGTWADRRIRNKSDGTEVVYAVWSTNTPDEAGLIGISGQNIVMSSPIDDFAIVYIDEDSPDTTAFTISGAGVIVAGSDERIKTDINIIGWDNILEKICSINCVTFKYKQPESVVRETNKYDTIHMGYIAQNIQQAFPDLVEVGENGILAVKMTLIVQPVIEAVKELVKIKNDQQDEINELKQKNIDLETRLKRIEDMLAQN